MSGFPFLRRWLCAAGFDSLQFLSRSINLGYNVLHFGRPDEGPGALIPRLKKSFNRADPIGNSYEDAATNRFVSNFSKPTFHPIQPTGTGQNEMANKSRMVL